MKVGDLIKRPPITIGEDSSIRQAARAMVENRVGLLVIVDGSGNIRGVVSERDIVRAVAARLNLDEVVARIMTRDVITVDVDDRVHEAAILMTKHGIRHLVVMKEGRLYGVVSMRDLVGEERILKAFTSMF